MLPSQRPLHVPALRDLIGLVRTLYASESSDGDPVRLPVLAEAGRLLSLAYEQATRYEPGSLAARAAPGNVAKGIANLGSVPWSPEVAALIQIAGRRVLR